MLPPGEQKYIATVATGTA